MKRDDDGRRVWMTVLALLAGGGLAQVAGAEAPAVPIVRDGRAACTIVVGREDPAVRVYTMSRDNYTRGYPARMLEDAARDLAETLHEMTGIWDPARRIPVVADPAQARARHRILLGSAAVEAYGLQAEAAALPYPAYIYRAVSNDLLIFGSSAKGAANGVYGFLQDELGVRWFGPQEAFRVVPWRTNVVIGALDKTVVPSFLGRGFGVEMRIEHPAYAWQRRMRMNESVDEQEPFCNASHNFWKIFPGTRYAAAHPEYYAMRSGRRVDAAANHFFSICFSNTNLVEIAAAAARAHFRANPRHQSFSLGINDCAAYCECEACAKLQPPRSHEGQRVASDMYFHFVNAVARKVREEFPDRFLGVIAYNDVTAPPLGPVEPNVHVCIVCDVSEYFDAAYRARDAALVQGWQAKGITLGFYYYTGLAKLVPAYFPRLLAEELKDKHRRGFVSLSSEIYPGWPWNGPLAYLQARLWWDIELDADALLNEYFDTLFGPAAGPMRELYDLFETIHLRPRGGGFLYEHYKYQQFRPYTADDLARIRALLAAAHAAVPGLGTGYGGHAGSEGQRVAYVGRGLQVFLDMLEGKVLAERLSVAPVAPVDNLIVADRLADIARAMTLLDRHTALYREVILADPHQSRRYLHDTCTPVRSAWRQELSTAAGEALAGLYRSERRPGDAAPIRARLDGLVADWTRDPAMSAMFRIRAGLVDFGPNLAANPGFETAEGRGPPNPPHLEWIDLPIPHWSAWQKVPRTGAFTVSEETVQAGQRSGCIEGIGDGCLLTRVPGVEAGASYLLEAQVNNTAHTVQENKPVVRLEARWLDARDRWLNPSSHAETQETDRWINLQHVATPPPGAATAVIMIQVTNVETGQRIFVDEVRFRKLLEPAPETGG